LHPTLRPNRHTHRLAHLMYMLVVATLAKHASMLLAWSWASGCKKLLPQGSTLLAAACCASARHLAACTSACSSLARLCCATSRDVVEMVGLWRDRPSRVGRLNHAL
jgi:hypothetical protein